MKEKAILAVIRWLLKFLVGYHIHRDPVRRKKEGEDEAL